MNQDKNVNLEYAKQIRLKIPDTSNDFWQVDPSEMCVVLQLEEENFLCSFNGFFFKLNNESNPVEVLVLMPYLNFSLMTITLKTLKSKLQKNFL